MPEPAQATDNKVESTQSTCHAVLQIGGLLSFNLIFPTDEPSIARLLG